MSSRSFWESLKTPLITFLETTAVKAALKKILGSASAGGIRGWLIKFIVEELFDLVALPVINLGARKLNYILEVKDGKTEFKKIQDSQTPSDWYANTDNL